MTSRPLTDCGCGFDQLHHNCIKLWQIEDLTPIYADNKQKPPQVGAKRWAEQGSNLRPLLCKWFRPDSNTSNPYIWCHLVLKYTIYGGSCVQYVQYFHTVLPELQPVAADMMQGMLVWDQPLVGKVRLSNFCVTCTTHIHFAYWWIAPSPCAFLLLT